MSERVSVSWEFGDDAVTQPGAESGQSGGRRVASFYIYILGGNSPLSPETGAVVSFMFYKV